MFGVLLVMCEMMKNFIFGGICVFELVDDGVWCCGV